jgi:ribosomal protein S27E
VEDISNINVYHPRTPKSSPLWSLLNSHYERFQQSYVERFEKSYGFFRYVIDDSVYEYLRCGDLKEGFARVRCPDCEHEYLLSFSCKGRWFCPSCHAKKVIHFGELLKWRHSGFSMNNGLRISRDYEKGRESVAQYILRNPFSVEKSLRLDSAR